MSFTLDGIEFTVENLTPAAFTQRLSEIVRARYIAFAQDSLSYDPVTLKLTDPFGAEKGKVLKLINTTLAGGPAIGTAVRGRVESQRLGMQGGTAFTSWQGRHLRLRSSPRTALTIAQAFFSKLPLVSAGDPEVMKSLLRTRALSSSLSYILDLNTSEVIAQFEQLRPEIDGNYSNAALWLVLLLGPEIKSDSVDGAATTWLQRGTRFDMIRGKNALVEAKRLIGLPIFA